MSRQFNSKRFVFRPVSSYFAWLFFFFILVCQGSAFASAQTMQGIYEIQSVLNPGFVMDEKNCTELDVSYAEIQMFRPLQVKQQEFYLEYVSENKCRIVNLNSGRYLTAGETVRTSRTAPDGTALLDEVTASVSLSEKAASQDGAIAEDRQLWWVKPRKDGSFVFRSASGLCLTLSEGWIYNGASLYLTSFTNSAAQKWILSPSSVYIENAADTDVVNPYGPDGPLDDISISIRVHDTVQTLSSETLSEWMAVGDDGHSLALDESKLSEYVAALKEQADTVEKSRSFKTSYGNTITLSHGNFGWKLNEDEMIQRIRKAIQRNGSCILSPAWAQKAFDYHGINTDIGDSYVEVDLKNQKVWLYLNGEQKLASECVSGTLNTDRETPGGVYYIYYMQAPAVLNGPGYSSPVNYWMPFWKGYGLHDAPWRSEFGGKIYETNGSHGCVNLPYDTAEEIYKSVKCGFPVVLYH